MNNNMYPQQQYFGGMQYQPVQQPKYNQALTPEEMAKIRHRAPEFNINVSEEDMLKAMCTHKENGQFATRQNNDGSVTCLVCGERFIMSELTEEQVKDVVQGMNDIIQTIKTFYLDIPPKTAREFFKFLPLLKKIPEVYTIAMNNFAKYERGTGVQQGGTPFGFNMFGMIAGGMPMQQPMYPQQQMMVQPGMVQQPMVMQQPMMMQPGMVQQPMMMAPVANPFVQQCQVVDQQQVAPQQQVETVQQTKRFDI